jgi:hypothetical protein
MLNDQDKDWIRLTAKELVYQVSKGIIKDHIDECPVKKKITGARNFVIGVCVGVGLLGTGTGIGFIAILQKLAQIVK